MAKRPREVISLPPESLLVRLASNESRLHPRHARPLSLSWPGHVAGGGKMVMNGQHVWQQNNHHLKRWDTAWVPNVLHVANVSRMIVKGARPPLSGLVEILSERSSKIRHFTEVLHRSSPELEPLAPVTDCRQQLRLQNLVGAVRGQVQAVETRGSPG